jgi:hypothetical protein
LASKRGVRDAAVLERERVSAIGETDVVAPRPLTAYEALAVPRAASGVRLSLLIARPRSKRCAQNKFAAVHVDVPQNRPATPERTPSCGG